MAVLNFAGQRLQDCVAVCHGMVWYGMFDVVLIASWYMTAKTSICDMHQWLHDVLPNVIKIDPYNFALYHFKVDVFFFRHSVVRYSVRPEAMG